MTDQIQFPALAIKDSTLIWVQTAEQLRTCTAQALKNRWFENLMILDSAGNRFTVASATRLRYTGKKAFKGWFAPRLIEVKLDWKSGPEPVTLDELKGAITRAIGSDKGFWESSGEDVDHLVKAVAAARDVRDIWNPLQPLLTASPTSNQK